MLQKLCSLVVFRIYLWQSFAELVLQFKQSCSFCSLCKEDLLLLSRYSLFVIAATETRYLNASNRDLCTLNEAELASDNANPSQSDNTKSSKLLQFSFHELKAATGNFRPDSILGEGGFGFVFKGWIEENGTAPAKPGSGITVAVKSLKLDGLQGHREWVVSKTFCFGFVKTYLIKGTCWRVLKIC